MNEDFLPLVSIWCPTYNQEKYISKCLSGFVMQQTNFAFEILVHDDASTDNTTNIVKEYELKYPHLFRCVYQTENQFIKDSSHLTRTMLNACKGKYIALCEGDDYWTDPNKLQKQVDFLEANDEYSLCTHTYSVLNEITNSLYYNSCISKSLFKDGVYTYTNTEHLKNEIWVTQPLTMMFRKNIIGVLNRYIKTGKYFNDRIIIYFLLKNSKGALLNFNGGVYRIHSNGVTQSFNKAIKGKYEFAKNHYIVFKSLYDFEKKNSPEPELINAYIKSKNVFKTEVLRYFNTIQEQKLQFGELKEITKWYFSLNPSWNIIKHYFKLIVKHYIL